MRCWSLKTARSTLCHGISCHAYIGRRAVFMPCALRLAPLPSTQPGARQRIRGLSPRPLLLAPSRPNAQHAADGLLGGLTRSPESWRGVFTVPDGRWFVTVGSCCPPGPRRGAYHGRESPWPRDLVLLDQACQPALACRF